ncbi:hypothetical protein [Bacillus sp. FSL M7-1020]|uniref:hypothetical protein n=1 Tax=Bacillus sp. FSL M7-1020 TaxID=2921540 RepID=UPI000AAE246C
MKRLILSNSNYRVAPLIGAWIEIFPYAQRLYEDHVAPLVGARIEITKKADFFHTQNVAPLIGAWIEIKETVIKFRADTGRTSYRCVD